MNSPAGYLVVLGDREPIAWVLSQSRMAFSANRSGSARDLAVGTPLLLYATRGAFRNPNRFRGRLFATAATTTAVAPLDDAVTFRGREFTVGCDLTIKSVAPLHGGPELGPLVPQLHAFPVSTAWSVYLRRPLVPLDEHDFVLLAGELGGVAINPATALPSYVAEASKGQARNQRP